MKILRLALLAWMALSGAQAQAQQAIVAPSPADSATIELYAAPDQSAQPRQIKVADAGRAQKALTGAPGRLSVIDPQTVYLRMPATFMESEACLITLRNLMMKAYDKEPKPEPVVHEEPATLVRQQLEGASA